MMKFGKKFNYVLLFVLIVLVSGCRGGGSAQPQLQANVYSGTRALEMRFVRDAPPLQFFGSTGDTYDLSMELLNHGTYPLRGRLYLSGFDPEIIKFPELSTVDNGVNIPSLLCGTSTIMAKSKANPTGGVCYEELHGTLNLKSVTDSYRTNIFAQAIYQYVTDATITMCIDPDVHNINVGKKACVMKPYGTGSGQGGPVGVTKIEPTALGDGRMMYRITIANLGRGEVVPPNKAPYQIKPSDVGYVRYAIGSAKGVSGNSVSYSDRNTQVQVSGLAVSPLTGNAAVSVKTRDWSIQFDTGYNYGQGEIRLHNNQAVITHIASYSTRYATQTPIKVVLSYDYMESAQQNVEIVNVQQYEPTYQPGGGGFSITHEGKTLQLDEQGRVIYRDRESGTSIDIPAGALGFGCTRHEECTGNLRCISNKCQ